MSASASPSPAPSLDWVVEHAHSYLDLGVTEVWLDTSDLPSLPWESCMAVEAEPAPGGHPPHTVALTAPVPGHAPLCVRWRARVAGREDDLWYLDPSTLACLRRMPSAAWVEVDARVIQPIISHVRTEQEVTRSRYLALVVAEASLLAEREILFDIHRNPIKSMSSGNGTSLPSRLEFTG